MALEGDGEVTRVSVSLSTLRAELTGLELRIVDRLNGALANKADRAILDQVVARQADGLARVQRLEETTIKREGPFTQRVELLESEIAELRAVGKYKRWLWAQTAALIAIAIPLAGILIDHWATP